MNRNTIQRAAGIGVLLCAAVVPLMLGCAVPSASSTTPASTSITTAAEKGAAEMWADNCQRCHRMRSPSSFSDREWDIAVHHMRVVANLTAKEHEAIVKFLKAGN